MYSKYNVIPWYAFTIYQLLRWERRGISYSKVIVNDLVINGINFEILKNFFGCRVPLDQANFSAPSLTPVNPG
jgi:hypothetical protein